MYPDDYLFCTSRAAATETSMAGNCDTFHKHFYWKSLTQILICSLFGRFPCPNVSKKLPKASILFPILIVKKITLLKFLFFIVVQGVLSNAEAFVCLSLLLSVAKKIVNKTSSLFEKVHGFVCLLIFQSGTKLPDSFF